jgi:tetratricopeptide (TPR) repeat protein
LARLGRGVCRIMDKQDDPGLVDLHELSDEIAKKSSRARFRDESLEGFKLAATLLAARQNYQGAIEVLAYEQALHPNPPASFFARLAEVFEKRGDQLAKASSGASSQSDLIKHDQQVRDLRTKAGDAYIAYSRCLTLIDDKGYGDAMWRGIDLYDQAANAQRTIAALELFVAERPGDPLAPDALLRLGGAYQAAGMFDKAVSGLHREGPGGFRQGGKGPAQRRGEQSTAGARIRRISRRAFRAGAALLPHRSLRGFGQPAGRIRHALSK